MSTCRPHMYSGSAIRAADLARLLVGLTAAVEKGTAATVSAFAKLEATIQESTAALIEKLDSCSGGGGGGSGQVSLTCKSSIALVG